MTSRPRRTCPSCGKPLAGVLELCPVCMLRKAREGDETDLGESAAADTIDETSTATPAHGAARFDHYELVRDPAGKPLELGRGAMGITYKALDLALRCPVALKVISEQHIGDEAMQRRFLREARAAARVRHPNVASVFYLGRTVDGYFYTMEFVEGESLRHLIKDWGRLETGLALELARQAASGLVAIHQQKLVHRDIKPSNIMVRRGDGGALTAKIIDLGLAKAVDEHGAETAISTPGAFAGTPEFASPEQYAGLPVDIRSDLYALGATLWKMLSGQAPFKGTPSELLQQHLHAPLALERLAHVPQPVVKLLEVLLEKNPARRFQSPAEVVEAMATVKAAIETGTTLTRQGLQKVPPIELRTVARRETTRAGPEKISVARLPLTGNEVFGREEDLAFLESAWTDPQVNIVTIVAWAGVGKSTLVNHWLRRMAARAYSSAERVFGWSFYRQGTSEGASSADEFVDATLAWFGDPDPRVGTAWEKGERLARLMSHRRNLLILDGLEPLQHPPGPQEGRLRESSLQALLRELAAFNRGLCVITTRLPVADVAEHEGSSVRSRHLEHLSSEAGAQLLRAMGVKGPPGELRSASDEFRGHCLALTLLGSYLTDACQGDIRRRNEVSARLAHDERQGVHARKIMESYQAWFRESPELSVLRILGLFDRPADEKALGALLKQPAIPCLTESLTDLSRIEWQTILAKLRRARLLAEEDPLEPGHLDTHPLVREYFGEQLRRQQTDAWKECNRRLYHYYRTLAPQLPNSFREMEPLFAAVIYGCNAGLYREALHDVYLPRIQRGDSSFAANVLGQRGVLLSVLAHFFANEHWGSSAETAVEGQSLTAEDELSILMQAGSYLTATQGLAAPEARICYEHAEPLCHSLCRPFLLQTALIGQWRYTLMTDRLSAAMRVAERVDSLAQEENDPTLRIWAYNALAATLYFSGDFESARQYAMRGVQIWRSGGGRSHPEDVDTPIVGCLCYEAMSEWHFGEIAFCHANMNEAILLAKELKDMPALAMALWYAAVLGHLEGNPAEVERLASGLIEFSTRHSFAHWLAGGEILRGWAQSASGNTAEGISGLEEGIAHWRATGSMLILPFHLALKAEALHVAHRAAEALEAINEAKARIENFGERWWRAEVHRLRGVFLAAMGADEIQIEDAFCEAIRTAQQQKSTSSTTRAEASYAAYRGQKGVRTQNGI